LAGSQILTTQVGFVGASFRIANLNFGEEVVAAPNHNNKTSSLTSSQSQESIESAIVSAFGK
jgi:hypothetical protein